MFKMLKIKNLELPNSKNFDEIELLRNDNIENINVWKQINLD